MKITSCVARTLLLMCAGAFVGGCSSIHRSASIVSYGSLSEPTVSRDLEFAASLHRTGDSSTGAHSDDSVLCVVSMNLKKCTSVRDLRTTADRLHTDAEFVPDFILCQEVKFDKPRKSQCTADVIASQLQYFCEGNRRTSDKEGVAIISRYPFEYYEARSHKARTSALLLGFRRITAMGEFHVPRVGLVRVVNVHFTNWPFEGHIRRKELTEVLQWIDEREKVVHADVTILGGDFNDLPDSKTLQLLNNPNITGSVTYEDCNSHEPTAGSKHSLWKRIDHIFVAEHESEVNLIHERILWGDRSEQSAHFWDSDHRPLLHAYVVN